MKALVKWKWCISAIFLIVFGCVEKDNIQKEIVIIQKVMIGEAFLAAERPWGISDGIKVIRGDKTEYFMFDIECPTGIIRNKATISFTYRLDTNHIAIHEKNLTYSLDSLYPFYYLNSLQVFEINEQYGAYFYTSLLGYPYDNEPFELVMWIYFDEKIYKISGTVPAHPDWSWENTYYLISDEALKHEFPETYNYVLNIWNQDIIKLKTHYGYD